MKLRGKVHKYGANVDTDGIIPARYLNVSDPAELASHCMEDIDAEFLKRMDQGDIIMATANFGCGSSREHAPIAIKATGISCVIAKSFARIFYRNALNLGLYLFECNTNYIDDGNELELDLDKNIIKNRSKGLNISFKPIPPLAKKILAEGGMVEYFKKHGRLEIEA